MKHILEPLVKIAGVRTAALITNDGVPITVHGRAAPRVGAEGTELDALAALAAGWVGEINRATAPLAWDAPRHLVLRAVRGTLVAMQAPGALLVVVLESGASAEEVRLPMEAAVGRMLRHLRQPAVARASSARDADEARPAGEPRAPLPGADPAGQPDIRRLSVAGTGQGFTSAGEEGPTTSGN
ncbi:MAG: roadblock/LC7 domain-containing protein [Planctomycetes bacterium]|nr:roadblock/LC7 domain-containing protein [Planctomycetota bacterium]